MWVKIISVYLFIKYIFSASHIPGNGLGAGNINMSKIGPLLLGHYGLVKRESMNKTIYSVVK